MFLTHHTERPKVLWRNPVAAALMLAFAAIPALAQDPPASSQATEGKCVNPAAQAEPATAPAPGEDATAPGNSGSTGWSGGTGGSQIGTNAQGAVAVSKSWHSPTVRGLDLKGRPDPVSSPDQAADRPVRAGLQDDVATAEDC